MKEFIKKHPALADVCDVILSLLCGSFALLAFGIVWILEKLADARQDMKEIVIYVHGKGGSAAEAGHYRPLFPDAEVVGFDYRA